ncbi:hypothetical protein O6H91_11G006200 [Diphasiastrum complanatum]|uniref:Uncharacterized protein n=5 Tax=Diphasiastrum complanatum TaxID=34168 RepID=A0ACC2C737_DIPCM|nr:hypothetical protein O6H91_11G006200 [Diphasiastrum complanatum]KAJ7537452.1 hypothetical protein O6H91_11G006200 [Diphasiastrum complanatum]KAJ7537453.1 hypothetical protein O6H91_11G006200 [Diphasiastrum complanatum]KAJ7537454.1 hypothetical protein O6H91_11G006200 [Diphasiastrum complanatum]KAJ7537455.1 hypothetical protein O6H91_11G006200 [Diphasiastrum complanatum]
MGRGWEAAKAILGLHVCSLAYPQSPDDEIPSECNDADGGVDAAGVLGHHSDPGSPSPLSSRMHVFRSTIRLARSSCAICLEAMKAGHGHALFTAECSHTFHFSCITANVRHGNLICPVCRAKWKDVPWQAPPLAAAESRIRSSDLTQFPLRGRIDQVAGLDAGPWRRDPVVRTLHHASTNGHIRPLQSSTFTSDPMVFDDDEPLNPGSSNEAFADTDNSPEAGGTSDDRGIVGVGVAAVTSDGIGGTQQSRDEEDTAVIGQSQAKMDQNIKLTAFAEVGAIAYSETRDDFTVLVHLKAPAGRQTLQRIVSDENERLPMNASSRAPIDLVTVLDVSGSMAGAKLRLLKRAMNFVITNLSADDRLSVVAFSSTAKRVLPLRRMVEEGKQSALRAIDGLISIGGTNIAEGLRKGAKVLEDRRVRNPVSTIILLSDGQDMYNLTSGPQNSFSGSLRGRLNHQRLLPPSIRQYIRQGQPSIPVHTFGFGADHDATIMHSVAEISGGTFSFIQAEETVQDAFAQCIGGLLSVVVQDVEVALSFGTDTIRLKKIEAGSYESSINESGDGGIVRFGDLYADEERDILLQLQLPAWDPPPMSKHSEMAILKGGACIYKDPISKTSIRISMPEVYITRPEYALEDQLTISLEVDSQRNRLRTAQSIVEAGSMADRGDIPGAQQALENAKSAIHYSAAWQVGDELSKALESELTEIQTRMANRQLYERSGRAYILSAHSSHFRQRATTRGASVDRHSRDYQTPLMVDMVFRSQSLATSPHPSSPRTRHRQQASPSRRSSNRKISAAAPSPSLGNS